MVPGNPYDGHTLAEVIPGIEKHAISAGFQVAGRHASGLSECPFTGVERKSAVHGQNDAIDRAPRGRELSVREDLTRIIVDWSGSWQAARPGNWLGRSPATKAALCC